MKLADAARGRDNNLNLIRLIAASLVMVSHQGAIVGVNAAPGMDWLGMTCGSIAVDVFFLISGFLVTASLFSRQDVVDFFWARVLRIYPALWVMLGITVLVIGPALGTLSSGAFLSHPMTWQYVLHSGTLVDGVAFSLPGLFSTVPMHDVVNGSLWTMPYELRMYGVLALLWVVLMVAGAQRLALLRKAVVVFGVLGMAFYIFMHFHAIEADKTANPLYRFFALFFTGAAFQALKQRIYLSTPAFVGVCAVLLLSLIHVESFFVVYTLSVAYIVFYLAYIPGGFIRKYNALGDYSYGIYIYGFLIQQCVVDLIPDISMYQVNLVAWPITLVLAVLSWHLLEQHALKLKTHCVRLSRRVLGRHEATA